MGPVGMQVLLAALVFGAAAWPGDDGFLYVSGGPGELSTTYKIERAGPPGAAVVEEGDSVSMHAVGRSADELAEPCLQRSANAHEVETLSPSLPAATLRRVRIVPRRNQIRAIDEGDDKFDIIMSSLQGMSVQVASSANDLSKVKSQMELTQMRCDQLTTHMTTMGNDIHSRFCQLEGEHSLACPSLQERMTFVERLVSEMDSTPTPHSSSDTPMDASVQDKIQAIEARIEQLSRPPSDARSSASDPSLATERSQENNAKLLMLGFPRRVLATTLRSVGEAARQQFAPTHTYQKITIKAFDLARKVALHFESASAASDFLTQFGSAGVLTHPDPLSSTPLSLRIRRDIDAKHRQLFLSMGKVRAAMPDLLRTRGYEVNSNGLGGCIYTLKQASDPIILAQLRTSEDGAKVEMELELDALREFGISQRADAFRGAASVQLRTPFRR
ncbi:unnamed protein product [Prorocentrum cordatum]|uniref:Uncharacterized protein n=1 Tax=Prorocentrum cordatum TaxID=2364126 RepID=A0ABN9W3D9_9DINO|nr:unnamed protein product [Polarella glacialis]